MIAWPFNKLLGAMSRKWIFPGVDYRGYISYIPTYEDDCHSYEVNYRLVPSYTHESHTKCTPKYGPMPSAAPVEHGDGVRRLLSCGIGHPSGASAFAAEALYPGRLACLASKERCRKGANVDMSLSFHDLYIAIYIAYHSLQRSPKISIWAIWKVHMQPWPGSYAPARLSIVFLRAGCQSSTSTMGPPSSRSCPATPRLSRLSSCSQMSKVESLSWIVKVHVQQTLSWMVTPACHLSCVLANFEQKKTFRKD